MILYNLFALGLKALSLLAIPVIMDIDDLDDDE